MMRHRAMRACHGCAGFALREVLVLGAVFFILLAVILPWMARSREKARRQQCADNLRRLGRALHNYHDTALTFPPGWIAASHPIPLQPNSHNWGWNALLLPYLNRQALYDTITANHGWDKSWTTASASSPISQVIQTPLPFLRCPSDQASATITFGKGGNAWGGMGVYIPSTGGLLSSGALTIARSSYAGVVGPNGVVDKPGPSDISHGAPGYGNGGTYPTKDSAISGTFFQNSRRKIRDFTDGVSSVIILGERRSPSKLRRDGKWYYIGGDTTWVGVPEMGGWSGYLLVGGDMGRPMNYAHPDPWTTRTADPSAGFSSAHEGGCHFLWGDGRVRFWVNTFSSNPDHNGGPKCCDTYEDFAAINDGLVRTDF